MPGIALIGTGHWGRNHARVLKELGSEGVVDRVKVCDADQAALDSVCSELDMEGVEDYRSLLEDPEVQAVSIVTPSRTHYRIAAEFMAAGKEVLVEKPMTMAVGEARELVGIAVDTGRVLMAGHLFRYHPAVRELKRRIDDGELGAIQNMVSCRLAFGLPRSDMGVVHALGIHELDMFCYLMGVDYPAAITAVSSAAYRSDIEETVAVSMDFGVTKGFALESWLVPVYGKARELAVVGSKKSARINYLNPGELRVFSARIVTENGVPSAVEDEGENVVSIPYAEPLKEEVRHFVSCVNSRQTPLTDGAVGLRGVVMAEAAVASAKTHKVVALTGQSGD